MLLGKSIMDPIEVRLRYEPQTQSAQNKINDFYKNKKYIFTFRRWG